MTSNILRYASSAALGTMIALSFLGAAQMIAPTQAHAQSSTTDYFPSDFSSGLDTDASIGAIAGGLINLFLGILGILAVAMILWGGFRWMTAGGEETKVEDAKKILIAGVIGLAIILTAAAIVNFVLTEVTTIL